MKYRLLAALAGIKILIISVWLLAGWDGLKTVQAQAPASTASAVSEEKKVKGLDALSEQISEKENGLIAAINRRQKELDTREENLKVREERLLSIKNDVETRVEELKKINERLEGFVKKIDQVNDERTKRIVKIYESMAPEEAASRLEKLDEEMAVAIIASMSEKKAAKILGLVDIGKSVRISQSLRVKSN